MIFFHTKALKIFILLAAITFPFSSPALALNWTYADDPTNDASGGALYEVHRLGYAYDEENLHFNMRTAFPQTGDNKGIEAGDLYINVGGSHNAGTGDVYGLALTNHEGDMNDDIAAEYSSADADNGYDWTEVEQGHLYSDAVFSTGVYENYNGADELSEDGGNDPFGGRNNIPVHIAEFGNDLGDQGDVTWDWEDEAGLYEVNAVISLESLGLRSGGKFELWWSMECGNELAMISGDVVQNPTVTPEPGTLLLLGSGLFALVGTLRKRKA